MTRTMISFAAAVAVSASALAVPAAAQTLRIGGNFPMEHSSTLAMERFRDAVADKTNGAVTIQLFPAMQLGGAGENIDQVRSGIIMGTWVGAAFLTGTVPELEAVSLPFVYPDREAAFRVIDGEVGDLLDEKLAERGFVSLGWMELGPRHVTNSVRAIESVEDFQGLKIRLQPNESHLATFRAIGANPISMGIEEVYPALQQGVLDGQENPYSVIATRRLQEVQTHLSDTNHFFDYIVIVANREAFNRLSEEHRMAIEEAMADAVAWQRERAAAEDDEAREQLIAAGMEFTPISDELRAELRERTAPVIDQLKARIGPDLVQAVLEEAGQ